MDVVAALLPIVVVLALMVGWGWPAARAGLAGLAVTLVVAVGWFGLGTDVRAELGVAVAVGGALAEAVFTSLTILWIIVPALAIHHLQLRTGGTEALRDGLARLSADPRVVALLIAWFFALFMEGAAGFGASVALAAPFLVGAGFGRLEAVATALVGHAVGVSFGAVGTPVQPQVPATGLSPLELSRVPGLMHLVLGWVLLVVVVALVNRMAPAVEAEGAGDDAEAVPVPAGGGLIGVGGSGAEAIAAARGDGAAARLVRVLPDGQVWLLAAAAGALFLVPYAALAWVVGPELPTLAGALLGGGAFVGLLVLVNRRGGSDAAPPPGRMRELTGDPRGGARMRAAAGPGARRLLLAGAPYLVLVAAVLVTRLVPPIQDALRTVAWRWEIAGTYSGSIEPLYHPGTMIVIGLAAGAALQRLGRADLAAIGRATVGQLGPVTVALLGMLGLSRLMVAAGMTDVLAVAAAGAAGAAWPLLVPLVGTLGTFVTGSATASNILFTDFQVATAEALDLPVATMAGAQTFGSAVGNIVCPHNIVAAGATVGLTGLEGAVLRRTLWVALLYAGLGGLLALVLAGPGAGLVGG